MRCCCDDVGPELMKCQRCGMSMAPVGRDGGAYGPRYCDCLHTIAFDDPEWMVQAKAERGRSGLWPGERWGDSLPCIGDVKCEPKPREEVDE